MQAQVPNFTVTGTINLFGALPDITDDLAIIGPGANQLTVRPGAGSPYIIFRITTPGVVNFSRLSIRNGEAIVGSGLFNAGSAIVRLTACEVFGNVASQDGGGVFNAAEGTLNIFDSTITGNSATQGGGILNRGTLNIMNSTISGNSAIQGGGIVTTLGGHTSITNSTISNIFASVIGGGIESDDLIGASVKSSIVAGNTAQSNSDLLGTFTSQGFNVFGPIQGAALINPEPLTDQSNITVAQLKLGPLQNNGGPTMTHALGCGSVAIDKGIDTAPFPADQRGEGFLRTFDDAFVANASDGDGTDVGAFERQSSCTATADLLIGLGVDKINVRQGDVLTYTITVRNFGPNAAINTVINDMISSGTTFQSASANRGTFTAPLPGQTGTVTWYLGNLENGGQESAELSVTVIVRGDTTITNKASAEAGTYDPNMANNSASITTSVVLSGQTREATGNRGGRKQK
jgi:uncharacterized repeat protein (TIGR01451 family)